uniref:Ig-like domain-containing protein n=1 Tax=Naja naja TaxID=35670 RepID=A0A8C6VS42_NAJNA
NPLRQPQGESEIGYYFLYFTILFLPFKGIDCQQSWIQPPSSSVSPAGTIRLSYTTQVDNTISWYQQKAGKGPRFVHCDGCGSSRGEEIPNRFTATRSGTTGTLTITNVEAEDEADYYCGRWNSAGNVLYSYGEGQQKPPLFLFILKDGHSCVVLLRYTWS